MRALTTRAHHSITLREFSLALFSHEPLGLRAPSRRLRALPFTLTYRINTNANIRANLTESTFYRRRRDDIVADGANNRVT